MSATLRKFSRNKLHHWFPNTLSFVIGENRLPRCGLAVTTPTHKAIFIAPGGRRWATCPTRYTAEIELGNSSDNVRLFRKKKRKRKRSTFDRLHRHVNGVTSLVFVSRSCSLYAFLCLYTAPLKMAKWFETYSPRANCAFSSLPLYTEAPGRMLAHAV